MKKTIDDIENSFAKLLSKHPELSDYTIENAGQFPPDHNIHDYNWVAGFIERAWAHTYQRRDGTKISRFIYSPGYLEWLLNASWADKGLMDFVIDKNAGIAGLAFGLNKNLSIAHSTFRIAMYFCKSVDPDHTKKGIGQFIHHHEQKSLLEREGLYDASAYWFDDLGKKKGGSMNTDKRIDSSLVFFEYPMLIRIIDPERAVENTYLSAVQKPFVRLFSGIPKKSLSMRLTVRPFERNDLDQVLLLLSLDIFPTSTAIGRYRHSEEEILRILDFRPDYQDSFTTISTVLVEKSQIVGLLYGFRIPIQEKSKDNIFFIDAIWVNSRISKENRSAFIAESLRFAWSEYDVYAAIVVKGTFPEDNLGSLIFLPVMYPDWKFRRRGLHMAIAALNERTERYLKNAKKMYIDQK